MINFKRLEPLLRPRLGTLKSTAVAIAVGWAIASPGQAQAQASSQNAPPEQSDNLQGQLAEIVVTAQKRSQNINDVGLTITAVRGTKLQALGITNVASLPQVASGLTVSPTYSGYPVFSIRGVNFSPQQIAAAPAVTAYIDEAPLPYPPSWGGLLLDVDHIEVLKGPQGTLFGENATGGAINVVAAKPTKEFSAGVQADADQYGRVTPQGYVSGPLSDTLAARLSVLGDYGGAWQEGYVSGYPQYDTAISGYGKFAGRLLLEWTPISDLAIELNINGTRDTSQPEAWQLTAYSPNVPAGANAAVSAWPIATNARQAQSNLDPNLNNYTYQSVVRADWSFSPHADLISVTNYVNTRTQYALELSGTAIPGITTGYIGKAKTFTQEIRVEGDLLDPKLHYIAGGFYEDDDLLDATPFQTFENYSPFNAAGLNGADLYSYNPETNRSYAFFGNGDLELVPGLTLTSGVRYTWARQWIEGCTSAGNVDGSLAVTGTPNYVGKCVTLDDIPSSPGYLTYPASNAEATSQTATNVSWRAGLNYKPGKNSLIYGLVSRGYKNGTFNGGILIALSATVPGVKPEELTSYEVGVKKIFFDRVSVDISGYHYAYNDKQLYTYYPTLLGANVALRNIPHSTVDGFDASVTADFNDITLNGSVTLADTKIGNYQTYNIALKHVDVTGRPFNFAPKWSATFGATYRPRLTGHLHGVIGIDGQYQDDTNSDLSEAPTLAIPNYTVVNARIGVESDTGWRAQFWVHNVADKYYWISTAAVGDYSIRLPGFPRIIGVTLAYSF